MSFGFSVGDFLAAASLIKDVVSALNSVASFAHHELEIELHGLQLALMRLSICGLDQGNKLLSTP